MVAAEQAGDHSIIEGGSMKIRDLTAALAAACMLAACGGGGDDAPAGVSVPQGQRSVAASASADVTVSNYSTLAAPLARAVMRSAEGSAAPLAGGQQSALSVAGAARNAMLAVRPDRESALAVSSSTVPCTYGGSITVTFDDADNNQQVSRGDVLAIALSACVEEPGGAPGNGSMTMTINAIELDANQEPTAMDVSVSVSGFAEDSWGSMNGTFRIWMKQESATSTRIRISYQAVTVVDGNTTVIYDFDQYGVVSTSGGAFDLQGGLRLGGHTYAVVGGDVFGHGSSGNPSQGSVSLRDAAGDQVVIRARSSTTVDLEFYPAGASTPTATVLGMTWASLR